MAASLGFFFCTFDITHGPLGIFFKESVPNIFVRITGTESPPIKFYSIKQWKVLPKKQRGERGAYATWSRKNRIFTWGRRLEFSKCPRISVPAKHDKWYIFNSILLWFNANKCAPCVMHPFGKLIVINEAANEIGVAVAVVNLMPEEWRQMEKWIMVEAIWIKFLTNTYWWIN